MIKVGRPLKYETPEQMKEAIDAYFAECIEKEKPPTIAGLAYALDMTTETLRAYGEKNEFSATIQKAKQLVEIYLEEGLVQGRAAAGIIFNLKNNFGWVDKKEIGHSGEVGIDMILDYSADE